MDFRLIYSNNGTLSDFSLDANNYYSGTSAMTFVAAEDKLYIGSLHPFNSIYLKMSVLAGSSAGLSIKYWDGSAWRSTVEVLDETNGLQANGYVTWQVDRQYGWRREDTVDSAGNANIAALSSVTIYDMHWIEVTLASDTTFTVDWIGQIFSDDNDLKTEHPQLNNSSLQAAIEAGKTDYEEQNVRASRILVEDLIAKGVITNKSQILDRTKMTTIAVAKVAEIVYNILGDDYIDQRRDAKAQYDHRINRSLFNIDLNSDGDLNLLETRVKQGYLYR